MTDQETAAPTDAEARFDRIDRNLVGLAISVTEVKREVVELKQEMNERFDRTDERFDRTDERFDRLEERFDRLEEFVLALGSPDAPEPSA